MRAALWMATAAFSFAGSLACFRALAPSLDVFEIAFLRNVLGLVIVAPMLIAGGFGGMRTGALKGYALRTFFTWGGVICSIVALTHMPLADAAALQFLIPIFAMLGAAIVLGERVGAGRWIPAGIAFVGALVIIRPGFAQIAWPALVMILSSAGYAAEWVTVKALSRSESPRVIVFYLNLLMLPLTAIPAAFAWRTPGMVEFVPLLILGALGWLGPYAQARALALVDASAAMPFDFLRLPFAAAIAFVVFGEIADLFTWLGAGIIFAAVLLLVRRERKG